MTPEKPQGLELERDSLVDSQLFRSKEVSWLSFNARVLQEAENPHVPPIERIRFLGIYSSNLDEFYRVRVATLKRLALIGKQYRKLQIPDPKRTLREVNEIVHIQTRRFQKAYEAVFRELADAGIRLITEKEVPPELQGYLHDYFVNRVQPRIMPIMVKAQSLLAGLKDHPMYMAVRLSKKNSASRSAYALLEIPTGILPRFVALPRIDGTQLVMFIDDIIRYGLPMIFRTTPFDTFESFAVKFTRDAEMEFDDDITESIYDKIEEGLRERQHGAPVRLNYDASMPSAMLKLLRQKLRLTDEDTLFPGARYHNKKDLLGFPSFGRDDLVRAENRPVPHRILTPRKSSIIRQIRQRDILLHFPYHSFNTFIDLLREASLDPLVHSIYLTQYRLARNSCVAAALMNAVRNGKSVTVMVEPRARFDEERNISYADAFQEAGVKVLLGVPGLKVHAKLCLICRTEKGHTRYYSCVGSGNFNEDTARVYTDHLLLTAHQGIGRDIERSFRFFRNTYQPPALDHLVAAPHSLRAALGRWIEREIEHHKAGRKAGIFIKINNLSDVETVRLLYRAADAGVRVRLIVRGMFSLVTRKRGIGSNIKAIGIVDQFLEHSRVFIFENGGEAEFYISSADFLPRNFDSRFEVVCPIYDPALRSELRDYVNLQWRDNVKARILDRDLQNEIRPAKEGRSPVRSQLAVREYLESLASRSRDRGRRAPEAG